MLRTVAAMTTGPVSDEFCCRNSRAENQYLVYNIASPQNVAYAAFCGALLPQVLAAVLELQPSAELQGSWIILLPGYDSKGR